MVTWSTSPSMTARNREAVREGRHDVVTAVGWGLAQALQDRGKFQDSLEVWEAVLSSKIEVFCHDHVLVADHLDLILISNEFWK